MEQPEQRAGFYANLMIDLEKPIRVISLSSGFEVDDIHTYLSIDDCINLDLQALHYDMVIYRLPKWSERTKQMIEHTYNALTLHGRYCVYSTMDEYPMLEKILGPRTSQVPVFTYNEMISVWIK